MREASHASERNAKYRRIKSLTEYQSCLVEHGASRAVHCPELNACFLNNCNTVHYGYAIPISVLPVDENSNLVELVLDSSEAVDPVVAGYLLSNHPDFKDIRRGCHVASRPEDGDAAVRSMETMAKHDHVRKFTEPEEDIAAIAKQISDHAEAIYQTWKSRGLAPTEILTCHSSATAADKFGTSLTPKMGQGKGSPVPGMSLTQGPALDANNLERFVNTFVVEDKARLAAEKTQGPSPHKSRSIQYALQKFEKNAGNVPEYTKPAGYRPAAQPTQISRPVPANQIKLQSLDTIEVMLPEEVIRKEVVHTPKRLLEFDGSNTSNQGVPTWPLKNKAPGGEAKAEPALRGRGPKMSKNSEEYMDEVRREEERLINALKCGMIINEETPSAALDDNVTNIKCDGSGLDTNVALKNAVLDTISGRSAAGKKDGSAGGGFSLVDYAKIRYKNAQENPLTQQRLEHSKEFDKVPTTRSHVISTVKNRFEVRSSKNSQPEEVAWRSSREEKDWLQQEGLDDGGDKGKAKGRTRHTESVPHPELTSQQRQHLRQTGTNPVRPFLTRGSVAERVLIFEKCPSELLLDKRRTAPAITTWRTGSEVQSKAQTYAKEKEKQNQRSTQPLHTTLRRHTKANKNVFIPRFYFPHGKPQAQQQIDQVLQKIGAEFRAFPMAQVPRDKFHVVVKACECPLYWKVPLFAAAGGEKLGYVDAHAFLDYWKQLIATSHDAASRFMKILVRGENRNFLLPEDFIPLIQDVVDTHPGLVFLKEANEFHSRYIHTVIARIFYCVNRSWSGRISLPELRRSNLLQVISLLEEEEDINQITQYFSYEHFYVIYCKFWELDTDHDLFIDRLDLTRHNDHALSTRIIDRIFSGAVTRGSSKTHEDRMSYTEFVWFLLSEEDKQHPTAIEYWFRCMDLDGDGFLSMYELEYFYEEQLQRMESLGIETLPFEDCLCQMLDMIHPRVEGKIALSDLKKCKMVTIFFDTFFNLEKYLDHEQRDPFASQRDLDGDGEMSDWDRYAAEEYELLVAEEGGNEHNDELMYDYLDQSDEDVGGPPHLLNGGDLDGYRNFDVPYTINAQIIPVNMGESSERTLPGALPSIHTNGAGGVQIQIKCPAAGEAEPLQGNVSELTIGNGGWDPACA